MWGEWEDGARAQGVRIGGMERLRCMGEAWVQVARKGAVGTWLLATPVVHGWEELGGALG